MGNVFYLDIFILYAENITYVLNLVSLRLIVAFAEVFSDNGLVNAREHFRLSRSSGSCQNHDVLKQWLHLVTTDVNVPLTSVPC